MIDNIPTTTVSLGTGDSSVFNLQSWPVLVSWFSTVSGLFIVLYSYTHQLLIFWIFFKSDLSAFRCIFCHGSIVLDQTQVWCHNAYFLFQICKNNEFSYPFQQLPTHFMQYSLRNDRHIVVLKTLITWSILWRFI